MWDKPKVPIDKVLLSDPEGPGKAHKEIETKGDRWKSVSWEPTSKGLVTGFSMGGL